MKFETAAVIGTGMMGPGIAVTLALGGLSVRLVSRTAATAEAGVQSARRLTVYLEPVSYTHLTLPTNREV